MLSNCCGANMMEEAKICTECYETCQEYDPIKDEVIIEELQEDF